MSLTTARDELRARLGADVSLPGDPGYDEARAVHNGMIDKRPAVIARCGSAADIAAALEFALSSNRDVNFSQVIAGVDPDPANAELLRRWTVSYRDATHPYSAGGAYVNFMMDEGQDRVRATYGPNYGRLTEIKAQYDPGNVFRVNQNILPAG